MSLARVGFLSLILLSRVADQHLWNTFQHPCGTHAQCRKRKVMTPSTARAVTTALQSIGSLDIMLLPPGLCSSPTRCLSLGTPRLRHALARQPHSASACLQALESNSRRRRSSPRSHASSQTCRRASDHPWDAPPRVAMAERTMARARVERQRAGNPEGRRGPARRRITAASHRPRGASGDAHLQGG
jgi:hypothetical protein